MKRIALIGSLAKSTADVHWAIITNEADKSLGTGPPAPLTVHGFHARTYADLLNAGNWSQLCATLLEEGRGAQLLGAEALVIGCSPLNPAAPLLRQKLHLPVIDLPTAVHEKLQSLDFTRVALLGCHDRRERTMWLKGLSGIDLLFPAPAEELWIRDRLADVMLGQPIPASWFIHAHRLLSDFTARRAQAVVLTRPTLTHWLKADEMLIPLPLDAATLHAWAAALWALHDDMLPAPPCVAV